MLAIRVRELNNSILKDLEYIETNISIYDVLNIKEYFKNIWLAKIKLHSSLTSYPELSPYLLIINYND